MAAGVRLLLGGVRGADTEGVYDKCEIGGSSSSGGGGGCAAFSRLLRAAAPMMLWLFCERAI